MPIVKLEFVGEHIFQLQDDSEVRFKSSIDGLHITKDSIIIREKNYEYIISNYIWVGPSTTHFACYFLIEDFFHFIYGSNNN